MNVDFAKLSELGIAMVALLLFFIIIKEILRSSREAAKAQVVQQNATNQVVQDNTKAINKLSNTLEKNSLQEENYRKSLLDKVDDIQDKVSDIHDKVV